MKRALVFLLHPWFWMVYIVLILVVLYALYREQAEWEAMSGAATARLFFNLFLLPELLTFYTFYFFLFPRFFRRRRYGQTVLLGAAVAAGAAAVFVAWMHSVHVDSPVAELRTVSRWRVGGGVAFLNLLCGTVALVIKGFSTWFDEVKLKEELLQKNHAMELALVKAQLDPHFLFNTINNIDVLILKDPAEASDYLNRLSDIMRFMLYETKTEDIALAKELEYLAKYVALQRIRTANSEYVDYRVDGTPDGHRVAPMVFIPFVENAFKHATNKKEARAIRIRIAIEPARVALYCTNKFDPARTATADSAGLGNDLIRRRLDLLYPGRHELVIERQTDEYQVTLSIDTLS